MYNIFNYLEILAFLVLARNVIVMMRKYFYDSNINGGPRSRSFRGRSGNEMFHAFEYAFFVVFESTSISREAALMLTN